MNSILGARRIPMESLSASISGSTLTITGTGLVTVTASQAGNGNYQPSHFSFAIHQRQRSHPDHHLHWMPATATYGAEPIHAEWNSILGAHGFLWVSGPASISGSTLPSPVPARSPVTASQAGNAKLRRSHGSIGKPSWSARPAKP